MKLQLVYFSSFETYENSYFMRGNGKILHANIILIMVYIKYGIIFSFISQLKYGTSFQMSWFLAKKLKNFD